MKVILVSGKSGSGKDTVSEMLEAKMKLDGNRVMLTHYADLLKYVCKTYLGWDGVKDKHGRDLIQHVGTDIVRKQDPNFWIDFIVSMIRFFGDMWDYVIISDCRFPNEVSVIKRQFPSLLLRVNRDNYENAMTDEQRQHESETALDNADFDVEILNNGTLYDLNKQVEHVVNTCIYQ